MISLVNPWQNSSVLGKSATMLNDFERNEFYRTALRAAVSAEKLCLEIWAGAGLLSMIAAKEGAGSVVAVEESKELISVAAQTMADNDLVDRVRLVNRLSTDV